MRRFLNAIYLNKVTLIISGIIAIGGFLLWSLNYLSFYQYKKAACGLIFLAIIVMLFIAYKKGETNVQKMLFGSLLTFMVFDYMATMVQAYGNIYIRSTIIWTINFILAVIVFISHMRQQMDHAGSSISTVVSQCCGLMLMGTVINQTLYFMENYITPASILWSISSFAMYIFIISLETRINEYKKIRTAKRAEGCWTEEERQKAKKIFKV